jgi:hypothetical protein
MLKMKEKSKLRESRRKRDIPGKAGINDAGDQN